MRPFLRNSPLPRKMSALPALLLALAVPGLCGCSSFRTEWGKPVGVKPRAFVEGRTPVAEVLQELGPPAQASALPDGFVFLYEHTVITEFQLGLSFNYSLLRFLKFVHAWDHIERETVLLTFDDDGMLRGWGQDRWKEKLSGGWAGQLVFSSVSLTDPSIRQQRADQHRWGRSCLERLPVALNSDQSLRSGEHGLQLSLAPKYAGQQTLDMFKPVKPRKKKFPGLATPR